MNKLFAFTLFFLVLFLSSCNSEASKLEEENVQLEEKIKILEKKINDLNEKLEIALKENKEKEILLDDYEKELNEVTEAFSSLQNQKNSLIDSLNKYQTSLLKENSTVGNELGANIIFNSNTIKVGDKVNNFVVTNKNIEKNDNEFITFKGDFTIIGTIFMDENNKDVLIKIKNEDYINILPVSTNEIDLYEDTKFAYKELLINNFLSENFNAKDVILEEIKKGKSVEVIAKFDEYNYLYNYSKKVSCTTNLVEIEYINSELFTK